MTKRLVYLIGQPGAGKSELMTRLTQRFIRLPFEPPEVPVAHDQLVDKITGELVGAEIGKRRELFSGTDSLPSSVIDKAVPWVESAPYELLLAEGARLANRRFLVAAHASYDVTVALLDHPDADVWRKRRAKAIGRDQNAAWVKGRLSASRNLADQLADVVGITVFRGHPDELFAELSEVISADG